jgi:hypothetical protein
MSYKVLDQFNAIWLFLPVYNDLTPHSQSDQNVSQWNGKEMKDMRRYLLGVVKQ